MNYEPAPVPNDDKAVREYLARELRRISIALKDGAPTVAYLTSPERASLSAGVSANWKAPAANVVLMSTSSTLTLTGIADKTANRIRTFVNIGTGVVVFKNEGGESSASFRFAVAANWNISAGGATTLWYDKLSARHRGLNKT